MAHTLADIHSKLAFERAHLLGQGWSEQDITRHLTGYEEELRLQAGFPDCDRCGTPDSSVRHHARSGQNLCVFCREDLDQLTSDDADG